MSWGINLILILIATGAVAWGFRYAGQQLTVAIRINIKFMPQLISDASVLG